MASSALSREMSTIEVPQIDQDGYDKRQVEPIMFRAEFHEAGEDQEEGIDGRHVAGMRVERHGLARKQFRFNFLMSTGAMCSCDSSTPAK